MHIQLIRHATLFIRYAGKKILVDPMLSPAGALPPVPNSANTLPNPLVNLTVNVAELLSADLVLLTHSHRDHFDAAAAALLPKEIPIVCQPEDRERMEAYGFRNVTPADSELERDGIRFHRTSGRHGTGEIGKLMGPVSGYVLQAEHESTLYIAGDTVWCDEVEQALNRFSPETVVLFAGAAEFLQGGPITMTERDIEQVCRTCPNAVVVIAHMEAWNHCFLKRGGLLRYLQDRGLDRQVRIPADGEHVILT